MSSQPTELSAEQIAHRERAWATFRALGSPKYVCAPMVDQSELPYRILCRRYKTELCYTPMLHAALFSQNAGYRESFFATCEGDRPLVAQFCANDPDVLLEAARLVEDHVDAVDINLGCPQNIAKRGHYGAFLMSEPDLVCSMVRKLRDNLKVPVFCKTRRFDTIDETLVFARKLQDAGCQLLTLHGRTKEQRGTVMGLADWDHIRAVKRDLYIPVYANGNIRTLDDVTACLEYTGADGVMSAEGLLRNPALFAGIEPRPIDLAMEYLEICREHMPLLTCVRAHMFRLLKPYLPIHTDLRTRLATVKGFEPIYETVVMIKARVDKEPSALADDAAAEARENHMPWSATPTEVLDEVAMRKEAQEVPHDILLRAIPGVASCCSDATSDAPAAAPAGAAAAAPAAAPPS